jgi:hypothetical protein
MNKHEFGVKLGLLVMEALAAGLTQDDVMNGLARKLEKEMELKRQRKRAAASY